MIKYMAHNLPIIHKYNYNCNKTF